MAYYDEVGFKDWTHAETGAPVLKAQHPEFEMWNQGIHARSGVACADCHMPYKRVGALKISDHHVRSPLLNINRACQTCHKWSEEELRGRASRRSRSAPSSCATWRWTRSSTLISDIEGRAGGGRHRRRARTARAAASARRSSASTSSRPRTRPASTRRRKPRASSARRSTSRARGSSLLRDPAFKPQHAPGGMGEPTPPGERGKGN